MVDFHTETALYSAVGSSQPTDDILNVNTTKTLDSPAGTWNAELVYRPDKNGKTWYDKLKPQDLVVIQMGRRPGALDTVMVGLVDDVRKTRKLGQNNEQMRRIKVSGRDMGKALVKALIKWFPQFSEADDFPINEFTGQKSILQMLQFYTKEAYQIGSPAMLIQNALTNILFSIMSYQVKYWRNGSVVDAGLAEIMRFLLGKTDNIIPFWTAMSNFEGAIWNYLTSVQNAPFNELFIDTRTDYGTMVPNLEASSYNVGRFSATFGEDKSKVVLFLRPTPFNEDDWSNLYTHEVTDVDIIDEDLGRSDHENYNMFLAKPKLNIFGETPYGAMVKPRFNAENIKRHGISFLDVAVEGLFDGQNLTDAVVKSGENLSDTLKRWYENNVNYENGSITLHGNGKVKVGQRIYNKDTGMVYYVESVSQNFTNYGEWKTPVSVSRGQKYKTTASSSTKTTVTVPENMPAPVVKQSEPTYYTVKKGDTLWGIAVQFYGDGSKYPKIVKANPQIKNPDLIYPGQKFVIPDPVKK